MNYFIAPRSGEKSYKNFKSTIVHGVPYENIESYLTPRGRELLLSEDIIYSWGNRPGTKSQWESMQYGDKVIFYAKGELVMYGEIYFKQQSTGLALAMWPPDENGQPWEYTYFLRNLQYIKMPMRSFNWSAGYKENFVVQGFIPLKPERVKKIEQDYGSVEQLLSIFKTIHSNEMPQAGEKLYVNIPEGISPIIRPGHNLKPKLKTDANSEAIKTNKKPKKIDYLERSKNNAIIGSKGEALVLRYEKERLLAEGRADLAMKVERMSDSDDTLGYDILTFEANGSSRYVEVKTSSKKSENVRFFMSDNEMRKSKELQNYYIYYVDAVDTSQPRIIPIECPFVGQLAISTHTYVLEGSLDG